MKSLQRVQAGTERGAQVDQASQEFRYGWIGPEAAMRHLGIDSLSALYRLIKEWRLPCGRIGRRYRFRRVDLDQWVTAHRAALSQVS